MENRGSQRVFNCLTHGGETLSKENLLSNGGQDLRREIGVALGEAELEQAWEELEDAVAAQLKFDRDAAAAAAKAASEAEGNFGKAKKQQMADKGGGGQQPEAEEQPLTIPETVDLKSFSRWLYSGHSTIAAAVVRSMAPRPSKATEMIAQCRTPLGRVDLLGINQESGRLQASMQSLVDGDGKE